MQPVMAPCMTAPTDTPSQPRVDGGISAGKRGAITPSSNAFCHSAGSRSVKPCAPMLSLPAS